MHYTMGNNTFINDDFGGVLTDDHFLLASGITTFSYAALPSSLNNSFTYITISSITQINKTESYIHELLNQDIKIQYQLHYDTVSL